MTALEAEQDAKAKLSRAIRAEELSLERFNQLQREGEKLTIQVKLLRETQELNRNNYLLAKKAVEDLVNQLVRKRKRVRSRFGCFGIPLRAYFSFLAPALFLLSPIIKCN